MPRRQQFECTPACLVLSLPSRSSTAPNVGIRSAVRICIRIVRDTAVHVAKTRSASAKIRQAREVTVTGTTAPKVTSGFIATSVNGGIRTSKWVGSVPRPHEEPRDWDLPLAERRVYGIYDHTSKSWIILAEKTKSKVRLFPGTIQRGQRLQGMHSSGEDSQWPLPPV